MKKKYLAEGFIMLMLIGVTGCGQSAGTVTEVSTETTEITEELSSETSEEVTQEITEDTQPETTQAETVDSDLLSDDLYSYQIIINGELYQIPLEFSDLTAKGWKYDGDESVELDANTYFGVQRFCNDDYDIEADIFNPTNNSQTYSECKITGISIDKYYNSGNDMSFVLAKGIQSGVSTLEDVKKAYGEPTQVYGDDEIETASYEEEYGNRYVSFTFYDGILGKIDIKNLEY